MQARAAFSRRRFRCAPRGNRYASRCASVFAIMLPDVPRTCERRKRLRGREHSDHNSYGGDYERRDRRLAELKRFEGILRAAQVSHGRGGSEPSQGLRGVRDVVEAMAKEDRG